MKHTEIEVGRSKEEQEVWDEGFRSLHKDWRTQVLHYGCKLPRITRPLIYLIVFGYSRTYKFDCQGYTKQGLDRHGCDRSGFDKYGYDRVGNTREHRREFMNRRPYKPFEPVGE